MFQYVLALLLINTYYQSLGSPLPSVNQPTLSKYLLELNHCENKFISEQINSKIQDCNITLSSYREKQLPYLMFYDINKQLCSSAAVSKLLPNEDYASKINESQAINAFCDSAKDFVFTNLTEIPKYKTLAEKLFKNLFLCSKVCGYSEVTNLDTIYYCKYFKWGFDLLNNKTAAISQVGKESSTLSIDNSNSDLYVSGANELNQKPNEQSKPVSEILTDNGKLAEVNNEQAAEASLPKPDKDLTALNVQQTAEASLAKPITNDQTPEKPKADKSDVDPGLDVNPSSSTVNALAKPKLNGTNSKPISNGLETEADKDDMEDPDTHQNSDEYDNGPEDGGIGVPGEIDTILGAKNNVPTHLKDIVPDKMVDVPLKGYPHSETDDFPEESDNFFPFFLTAVVLVILLYILYHNKNKVTKVFFGLVLEGRQGSRRRNSRGHAYRRLDTLEQAMSAKTAMPPSQIIY